MSDIPCGNNIPAKMEKEEPKLLNFEKGKVTPRYKINFALDRSSSLESIGTPRSWWMWLCIQGGIFTAQGIYGSTQGRAPC